MVGQPVQESSGQPLGSERFRPFVERQVAGDQRRTAFVAPAEDLEQQFGPGLGQRHEAQFVDEQQLEAGEHLLKAHQAPFVLGFDQLMRQRRRSGEPDAKTLLASGQAQGQRNVGFPGA